MASEGDLGRKWDRCLADSAVKLGKTWPIILGSGMGLGMAYSNCQHDFQSPYLLHGRFVKQDQ
ncbi:MICOS complex subunit MIC10 isoform X3 [Rhineura floridana]|uniref:MICOS complex subunit MIC10 isoform X3 n=1 Tax=Rhineura floridana TaxID=261503 RepID=UPI002AC86D02|nr:MICOS complex subunit MIC10 isoform X3 [Rhineura floridana]